MKPLLIITGANGQVGSFLAKSWAGSRQPLLLLYHKDSSRLEALRDQSGIHLSSCDLRDLDELKASVDEACHILNAVPASLVHTAAVRSYDAQTMANGDPEIWQEVFGTNVTMACNVLKACLPGMLEQKFGRIVLFGSNVVSTGLNRGSAYAAAKAAIVNLARSVALETAPDNVLINSISPAPVETDLKSDFEGAYLAFRQSYFEAYRRLSPTGKLISLDEIRHLSELLLSSGLANLNGQDIVLDGGLSAPLLNPQGTGS
ncbi:MAG: SDR family NAD(P)-dependent oxidoreductase [Candidatus Cloacimonetes bacterium]|nr:SDR family NAD(P)-dependent oxidoreductase [Candidatus Cloacimonadota bacterium]